jgi:hypothetical protein
MLHLDGRWDCSESVLGFWVWRAFESRRLKAGDRLRDLGPFTGSLLVRDARTKEELAHGVLKGQNDRRDISVMDAKERPDADVTGLLQAWPGGE